jgi:UDP-N-acetylmuramoyl-L-alanyl-D-glutamate--2,6-diaminopimelate ligase
MRLRDLADVDSDSQVTGFAIDHRKVTKGNVFGAFRGAVFDGEDFIPAAVQKGAVAVVARPEAKVEGAVHLADEQPRRLFDEVIEPGKTAVIWTDDPKSDAVIERAKRRGLKLMTVGRKGETIRLVEQMPTSLGQTLILEQEGKEHRLALPLIGAYQASNVMTAAALVLATGGEWRATFSAMGRVAPVRGRLERAVISRAGAPVYVDYAHTPDALEAAIMALKPHVEGKLIIVFGAGGDRDQGKRAPMGEVAMRLADVAIVTDDNPRSEDPARIRADIIAGAPGAIEVAGRKDAIARALEMAGAGDIVLLAGKGHETGQIVGKKVLPFDDALVARECAA